MPIIYPVGMERLGSVKLASNAATTGALTIPARDFLFLAINIVGYSSGDIAALRFNGDNGSNYWDMHKLSALGATTWTNAQTVSTTLVRLAGNGVTDGRVVSVSIMNVLGTPKAVGISHLQTNTSSAAGTGGTIDAGGGCWVNTTAQVTSIEMRTAGGANLLAGSGFAVFGINL